MLHAETITFLKHLAKNNNKVWFDANRDKYAAAKDDFEVFVTEILKGLTAMDPAYGELKAKDCIFRIFRDVRFGKDKTPYKAHFGASFSKGGKKTAGPGFYLHIEPGGKCFAGGGMWMPEGPALKAVRQEIDYNFKEFTGILENKKFKKMFSQIEGEKLKTLPQGYTADNPAIELLKLKSYVVSNNMTDEVMTSKAAVKNVLEVFTTMNPFIQFLERAVA